MWVMAYKKTRTTPAGNGKHLHILTFLGGRASVCRIICAIGDCLDTPGMLEDLPVPGGLLILAFGELIENLTRRRNDLLILKKVRFVTLPSVGIRCVYRWPILTLLLKLPVTTGQTRTMWSDNIMSSYIHVNFEKTFYQQQKPHAHVSAGAVHDTKYLPVKHFSWGNLAFLSWWYMPQSIFPSNISPGGTLHFCHGGTCHKVSSRQTFLLGEPCISVMVVHATKYLPVKHFSWGNLAFLSWWYMPQSIFPSNISPGGTLHFCHGGTCHKVSSRQTFLLGEPCISVMVVHATKYLPVKHFSWGNLAFLSWWYMPQSIFPSNISPGGTLHFCHGGTCHKVSSRQTFLLGEPCISVMVVHATKYLPVKHFSWGNLAFLSWWYMPQSIFPSNISPGGTLHFCHGGTCHKVSSRQTFLLGEPCISVMVVHATKYLPVKHFSWGNLAFLSWWYMPQSIFPSNISPGGTLHFCHGGTCHKVSSRQTFLLGEPCISVMVVHATKYLPVKHFSWGNLAFLSWWYMPQSIFPSNISPGGTLHFCHGGTCHKVSSRQTFLLGEPCISVMVVHATKYLPVKHFSWGNLAFLSWWYMPQSIFPPA